MYQWEMDSLQAFAKHIVKENPMASTPDTRKISSEEKTVKLDSLAQVVLRHLSKDGEQPLTMKDDGHTLLTNPCYIKDMEGYPECDRIVVYSAFPSSNQAILDIFDLYGISATQFNGSMSPKKRVDALKLFRMSTRTNEPRVLILSNVGLVGLNLACANVMVIVDTTWSALNDEQLQGRIFRYPQRKQVHVYCLIAVGTPDMFLNNISFDKGQLHSAFVGSVPEFSESFLLLA
ncbi:hypothetical protein PAXRUDRAFT_37029 [Paxillus rubicundulus Ve08.2h10]|uniref:Helicase C-terminal domain-containing protein n=1 Tax=Paxillus rubicundulus Ve08.2h10 TaxID=930991 RepID=A0A0D0D3X0_9AGAM|nr:hypothetical protein PAXRUDRAFT_37029 [Paxillus rubicundulus Ve08.2h10]